MRVLAWMLCVALLLPRPARAEETAAPRVTRRTVPFHPAAGEDARPVLFRLSMHEFPCEETTRERSWAQIVRQIDVTFPSPVQTEHENNNTVHAEYFLPSGSGTHPGVIVLHILGGDFELSRLCCRTLAINGVGALFVKMPYYGPRRPAGSDVRMISPDPEQTMQGMRQAVLDIRRAAAWLGTRQEIDDQQLGISGISLGGVVAALAASAEPRFHKACLVLAGGNFEKIIRESTETEEIRQYWAGREINPQQVAQWLGPIDPLTYATALRGRQVLMLNARNDRVVPPACTEALWEAAGRPEIEWWDADHYSAIWYLPKALSRMVKFFQPPATVGTQGPVLRKTGTGDENTGDHGNADSAPVRVPTIPRSISPRSPSAQPGLGSTRGWQLVSFPGNFAENRAPCLGGLRQ